MKNLDFLHKNFIDSDCINVIVHGGSAGYESEFIQKIYQKSISAKISTLAFNFKYISRGEENPRNENLNEELADFNEVIKNLKDIGYSNFHIIAKSLGGIVSARFLNALDRSEHSDYKITILGYVTGSVKLKNFSGQIDIIQGEKDRFGDIEAVKFDMREAISNQVYYYAVTDSDHSYRNELKQPIYEDKAIGLIRF